MTDNSKKQYVNITTSMRPTHRVEIIQTVSANHKININCSIDTLTKIVYEGIDKLKDRSLLSNQEATSAELCFSDLVPSMDLINDIPVESQGFFHHQLKSNFNEISHLDFSNFPPLCELSTATFIYLVSIRNNVSKRLTKENISLLMTAVSTMCTLYTDQEILNLLKNFLGLLCIVAIVLVVVPDDKD